MIPIKLTLREVYALDNVRNALRQVERESARDDYLDTGEALKAIEFSRSIIDKIIWRAVEKDD